MWVGSIERQIMSAPVRIPNLDHLLALKLHAARYAPWRKFKDMSDIVYLTEANQIDVKAESFELCACALEQKKFMSNFEGKASDLDLEFPIDPEFHSAPPKMSIKRYVEFSEAKVPYGLRDRRRGPENTRPPEEPFEL